MAHILLFDTIEEVIPYLRCNILNRLGS